MKTPEKPDLARGWLFVEKLLAEEERERLAEASDDDVDATMGEFNAPSRVPSAEELLARALERSAPRGASAGQTSGAQAKSLPARPRRARGVTWLAAAAVGGIVVAVVANERSVAHPAPDVEPTAPQRVAKLREEAYGACREHAWTACEHKLDAARGLDPAGESNPRVVAARAAIADGRRSDTGGERR